MGDVSEDNVTGVRLPRKSGHLGDKHSNDFFDAGCNHYCLRYTCKLFRAPTKDAWLRKCLQYAMVMIIMTVNFNFQPCHDRERVVT